MTVRHQHVIPDSLFDEFMTCTKLQYNGKLDIESFKGYKWTFYYRLGRIVWATGGCHQARRWRRNIMQYCPHVDIDNIQLLPEDAAIKYWDYRLLELLYKNKKINRDQVNNIVDSTILELLFDLAQQSYFNDVECDRNQKVILDAPMSLSSTDVSLRHMRESWSSWSEAGLTNFSPNSAPVLRHPQQIQQLVSPGAYKNFVKLMNGKYTLRDLAVKMKQDLLSVTHSLMPYILRGIIELVEVEDLPLNLIDTKKNLQSASVKASKQPLIACVDDSPQVCQILKQIISSNGMKFIGIQDPVKILPTLIEQKPDLIFLDLIMPVANGYEICTQIRRISCFANTPVVILTGSDGLFDRVRARVSGSTDFITKPVVADKVMAMVSKHLQRYEVDVNVNSLHLCNA